MEEIMVTSPNVSLIYFYSASHDLELIVEHLLPQHCTIRDAQGPQSGLHWMSMTQAVTR